MPALGLLAAAPIVIGAARAIAWGWTPAGDEGVIAARSFDVLSTKPPLLGQFSQASSTVGQPTYSLGPLPYWLLAIPAHIGPAALVIVTAAVNVAAVVASVALARQRAGVVFAVAVALGLVFMTRSVPAEVPYSTWNPHVALFPFMLLLFLAWSVACGAYRLLPVLAVVASFVVQAHLAYLLPSLGTLAIAAGGLVVLRRRADGREPGGQPGDRAWGPRQWALAAALIALVCWSAPLAEQARHRPGNVVLVARALTADPATLGPGAGVDALIHTVGLPPWWLRDGRENVDRLADVTGTRTAGASASALLVLAGILILLVLALRRRRHAVVVVAALSLWLGGSVALVARSVPADKPETLAYSLYWASAAGAWIWLTSAWAAWVLLVSGRSVPLPHPAVAASVAMTTLAAAAAWVVSGHDRANGGLSLSPQSAATAERAARALPDDSTVLIDAREGPTGRILLPAVAYALRREGTRVLVPPSYAPYLGARYHPTRAYAFVIAIRRADAPARPGARVLARFPLLASVTLSRAP